jgi:hypothetical protein
VRGLAVLRAFLSRLAHGTSSTGHHDEALSFFLGKTKHNIVLTSSRNALLTMDWSCGVRDHNDFKVQPLRGLVGLV